MSDEWQYQIRIKLNDEHAKVARKDPQDVMLAPLGEILLKHNATLRSQYDAFYDYCSQAEMHGIEKFSLYQWTKDTIEDPVKKEKYLKAFTFYIDGEEIYGKEKAGLLETDLEPLAAEGLLEDLTKHDTNPANNPQPPSKYRQ